MPPLLWVNYLEKTMRNKTLNETVIVFHNKDPSSAMSRTMLDRLIKDGIIPYEMHGNRVVIDYDLLLSTLNEILGFDADNSFVHLRSIESAIAELKEKKSEIGVGADRLRKLIANGLVPAIKIGNRSYIAMEAFDPPYDSRLSTSTYIKKEKKEEKYSNVDQQIAEIIRNRSAEIRMCRL